MTETSPSYRLTLHKTYYDKGFFNLGVEIDRFVRQDNGPISIRLGDSSAEIEGKVNRNANLNNTPRVSGGLELRNWIQSHFSLLDAVDIVVLAPDRLWIRQINTPPPQSPHAVPATQPETRQTETAQQQLV